MKCYYIPLGMTTIKKSKHIKKKKCRLVAAAAIIIYCWEEYKMEKPFWKAFL